MNIGEFSTCLDLALIKMGEGGYQLDLHLRNGAVIVGSVDNVFRGSLVTLRIPGKGPSPKDTFWWVPLDEIIALEVTELVVTPLDTRSDTESDTKK